MRYTNIIDISEFATLYECQNVRLVYLHLALKAGHQPYNKGMVITTYTRLADQVGITVSALRWALSRLVKLGIIKTTTSRGKYHKQLLIYVGKRVNKKQEVLM